jgi:hypothetical protein
VDHGAESILRCGHWYLSTPFVTTSQLHHNGLHGSANSTTIAVTEEGGMMKITDPQLFKAIETAIASGNTVYLVSPDYQSMGDGPELMRNSTLIRAGTANSLLTLSILSTRINSYEC